MIPTRLTLTLTLLLTACSLHAAPAPPTTAQATTSPSTKPARFIKEIEAFEAADKKHPPQPNGVLLLGSSSIRIWKPETYFPNLPVVNRGFGGSEISDSVHYFDRIVPQHKPKLIIFYAGDNDIAAGKSPARVAADFSALLGKVRTELPETKLLVIAIKPSLKRWSMIDKMRDANQRINDIAAKDSLTTVVSMEQEMLTPAGTPRPDLFQPDGLHMNPTGYEIWTKKVMPYVDASVAK